MNSSSARQIRTKVVRRLIYSGLADTPDDSVKLLADADSRELVKCILKP